MRNYDPSVAPDSTAWLEMDEDERLEMVREYHRRQRIKLPNVDAHALTHAVIENQLAEGLVPASSALNRLLAEGLDRHEAVHALGSLLMEHIWNLTNKPRGDGDPNAPYLAALDKLTAARGETLDNKPLQRMNALRGSFERGPCRDTAG